jgi:hypothetical protein
LAYASKRTNSDALVPPAEAVRHHRAQSAVVALEQHRQARGGGIEGVDVGRGGGKAVLHHQQRVDCFLHTGRAQRVAGQRLGRADHRHLGTWRRAEHLTHRAEFGDVAQRRRSAVRVDVVHRLPHRGQRLLHAAHRAFARRCHHVVTVGGGTVADEFGQDGRAARLRMPSASSTSMPPPPR